MIGFFRSFFQSKIGLFITFVFVGLIALAFAGSDITGSGAFGGVAGGETAAEVGNREIGTGELSRSTTNAFDNARQSNPQLDLATFVDQGGLEGVLNRLSDSYALQVFGASVGMTSSKRLVDSEIASIGAFRGPDGKFSEEIFRQVIRQQGGVTEKQVRDDLARGLVADQVLRPVSFGSKVPSALALPYASLVLEGRKGRIAVVPSALFLPDDEPTDKLLASYYQSNRDRYKRPERRTIRYAVFDAASLNDEAEPTEEELQGLYELRKQEFAASQTRTLRQVVLPTEAAAQALLDRIRGGADLDAAAQSVGLSAATINAVSKEELRDQTSVAVADAAFQSEQGALLGPAQSALGWHIFRVTNVKRVPARSFADARNTLARDAKQEKLLELVAQNAEEIEDAFSGGATLDEVAEARGIQIQSTPALTSDGNALNRPEYEVNSLVQRILPTAFGLEEDSNPQLFEIEAGKRFGMFAIGTVTPSAPPPLKDIRKRVVRDFKLEKGSVKAKQVADTIIKKIGEGTDLDAAMAQSKTRLPPSDSINTTREQLSASEQRVPPPLALMFSMAKGTAKRLEAPAKQGWFIVMLDEIDSGDASTRPELLAQTRQELKQILSNEYSAQFLNAVKSDVGVKKNDAAVKAIADQLTGRNRAN